MYYDFFGFREPPFSIAPDPRYLYLSERHKEALAHLMYGVRGQGGFIVITGEVGTGKTTVSRCFIENVPAHVDIALILNPRLSARELLSAICDELGIAHPGGASIKQMVDLINQDLLRAHAAGRHKVLLIDEAQNLSADVLEQLRLLTNLETAEKKLLQIVLLGQPELQQKLALPQLRQLNQRVTARYHLDAISRGELPAYLSYRLGVAGMRGDVFSPSAVRKLYRLSHGIPRLINLISDRALLGAYAEGEHEVTAAHIRQAAREVGGGTRIEAGTVGAGRKGKLSDYFVVFVSVLLAVISSFWVYQQWTGTQIINGAEAGEDNQEGMVERAAVPEPEQPRFRFSEHSGDKQEAFVRLFDIWEIRYTPEDSAAACDFARVSGLGCLERQGSRRSLAFLDRPAILRLQDDTGTERFAVLRRLDGQVADLMLSDGVVQVPFDSLEPYWFGEYQVLWQLPDYLASPPDESDRGGEELWLGVRMMELADIHSDSSARSAEIKRMALNEQIRWYQSVRGLTVDGIAGAMTVIQINNDLDAGVPRLASPGSGGGE